MMFLYDCQFFCHACFFCVVTNNMKKDFHICQLIHLYPFIFSSLLIMSFLSFNHFLIESPNNFIFWSSLKQNQVRIVCFVDLISD